MVLKELFAIVLSLGIIVGVGALGHRMADADTGGPSSAPSSFNARYLDD